MKQFDLGKPFGAYYTQLQRSLSLTGVGQSLVGLTVLWAVASDDLQHWLPWLTYPLFMGIVFFAVMVAIPAVDYVFIYKTQQRFLNVQGYKHDNPFRSDLEIVKADLELLKAKLGITGGGTN